MRLIRLDENMRSLVCAFDPFSLLEQEEYLDSAAYGIISEAYDGYEGMTGLMIMRYVEEINPLIEWLYVSPEHRNSGYAGFALDEMVDSAYSAGGSSVYILLKERYGSELVYDYDEDFFSSRGFVLSSDLKLKKGETLLKADTDMYIRLKEERELYLSEYDNDEFDENLMLDDTEVEPVGERSDYSEESYYFTGRRSGSFDKVKKSERKPRSITLADIVKSCEKAHLKSQPVPVPVGELSLKELKEGIEEAMDHHAPSLLEDILSISPDYFNPVLSYAVRDGENISALLLVHENLTAVSLEICLLYAIGKRQELIMKLFKSFAKAAGEEGYPKGIKVKTLL